MATKNIILGFYFNNAPELPLEFIRSFENVFDLETHLVLFVNFRPPESIFRENVEIRQVYYTKTALYKATKLVVHKYQYHCIFRLILRLNRWLLKRWIRIFSTVPNFILPILIGIYPVLVFRFFYYLKFLKKNEFNKCFLTDTTDVIFQSDLFAKIDSDSTCAFAEKKEIKIRDETFNFSWITKLYNKAPFFEKLADQEIYCAGTIFLGSQQAAKGFLRAITNDCLSNEMAQSFSGTLNSKLEFSFRNPYDASDQGIFNKLIFLRQVPFECKENGDLVYTIGSEPREDIGLDEQFIFKKCNPIVPAVVHQYNRHPDLLDFVKKKYGV